MQLAEQAERLCASLCHMEVVCIPATLSSATTEVGSSILVASPEWLPRPALPLLVTSLNSLVSLCEPGAGRLSGFRACDLKAVTTACNGKVRKHSSRRLGGGGGNATPPVLLSAVTTTCRGWSSALRKK